VNKSYCGGSSGDGCDGGGGGGGKSGCETVGIIFFFEPNK